MKTEQIGSIHERLVKIMEDVEAVEKKQINTGQNFNFRGIDNILNSLHTIFKKHGVFASPEILEYKVDYMPRNDASGKPSGQWTSILIKLRLNFKSSDGSTTCSEALGHGMDIGDKAAAKAMSMAVKYALINTFLIPTADDKDGDAHNPAPAYYKSVPKSEPDKRHVETMAKHGAVADDENPPFDGEGELPKDQSWRSVKIHVGKAQKGVALGNLDANSLQWWQNKWVPGQGKDGKTYPISDQDMILREALDASMESDGIPF